LKVKGLPTRHVAGELLGGDGHQTFYLIKGKDGADELLIINLLGGNEN